MRYLENENPFIWVRFATGDTVTITIYNSSDNSIIINAVGMSELSTTGYFKYQFNPSPAELTEYFYIATNSTEEHAGKIILGGYPDSIKDETDKIQTGIIDSPNTYKADVSNIPVDVNAELTDKHGAGRWKSGGGGGIIVRGAKENQKEIEKKIDELNSLLVEIENKISKTEMQGNIDMILKLLLKNSTFKSLKDINNYEKKRN